MKLITSYNDYIVEKMLVESIREMKFVLSDRLIDILKSIYSDISDKLLKSHNDLDFKTKHTFIDIKDGTDDSISFILANKAGDLLEIDDEEELDSNIEFKKKLRDEIKIDNPLYKRYRGSMKIGRFINTLFPGEFQSSSRYKQYKINDVESFVNMYKVMSNKEEKFKMFDLVSGTDIAKWYYCDNYLDRNNGSLGGSCMSRHGESYFTLYTNNDDKVQLLIYYSDETKTKIKGRALVWKLDEPNDRFYMDRIYTNDYSDEKIFIEYAKSKDWLFRSIQGYQQSGEIADPRTEINSNIILKVYLKPEHHNKYPYLDTLVYHNPDTGLLSNRETGCKYLLTSTGGDYDYLDDDYDTVYSDYHGDDIMRRDAVYCELGEDWVLRDEALRVYNTGLGSEVYAISGYQGIVHSVISNKIDKYFPEEKCIWSDYHNTWIFKTSARKVYLDKNKTSSILDHKVNENETFAKVGEEYYDIGLVTKDSNNNWKLKD